MKNSRYKSPWHVYIVECRDKTLYTGVTKDVAKRIKTHNAGTGCRYTRSRTPVTLRYTEGCHSRSAALKREAGIKRLERCEKLALMK
ncbi:MAG: GIY-YIG nuclease family protein [Candidatus Omnitrophica bacterium]|nr:GIY-YIG nuclease family protein [Candidatus Omnitrophota bacterium]